MRFEPLSAHLLGNMSFKTGDNEAALKPIIKAIRAQLPWLDVQAKRGVGLKRLGDLLQARARILNDNERHNRHIVRVRKVGRRRVGNVDVEEEGLGEEGGTKDLHDLVVEQDEEHDSSMVGAGEQRPVSVSMVLSRLNIHDTITSHRSELGN
jgi:hypothetical protein